MLKFKSALFLVTASVLALTVSSANAREGNQISIVGSSTVYPFATIVAEKFGQSSGNPTPVIESTGTGGGMKLFCAGIGLEHPDVTNASRAIKSSEAEVCSSNGIEYQEFIVGNDGLAFSNSNTAKQFNISIAHIYAALVNELPGGGTNGNNSNLQPNNLKTWDQVDTFVSSTMGTAKIGLPVQPLSLIHI